MFKLRFHLGRGDNYMKWQVSDLESKEVYYHNPNEIVLELFGVTLYNRPNQANAIKMGSHKTVCAWMICENLIVHHPNNYKGVTSRTYLCYNPRIHIHFYEIDDVCTPNVDANKYTNIRTQGRELLIN